DNSDPLRPRNLEPPMRHLPFTPGVANNLMPDRPGETQVSSFTGWLPSVPFTQDANSPEQWPDNEFNPERVSFETQDANGNPQLLERVSTLKGASAQEIATVLSGVPGVTARAFTELELTNFRSGAGSLSNPEPTEVSLNGFDLTIPGNDLGENQQMFKEGYIEEVPTVITPDFLANRINSSYELAEKGITAKSDGVSLRIIAENGDDLQIELRGNAARTSPITEADQFEVGNGQQIRLSPTGSDTRGLLTENQPFDFSERGPYTYDFTSPYGEPASIELTENYATKEDMLDGIAQKIEAELISQERIKRNDPWLNGKDAPGRVQVNIDERGDISFKVLMKLEGQPTNASQKITMGGTVDVVMDEGISMSTEHDRGNVFFGQPKAQSTFLGHQFEVDGTPEPGDRFEIDFNKDPSGDNRNAEKMIDFQTKKTLNMVDGGSSFIEAYSQLAEEVGTRTRQAQINTDAAAASVDQTTDRLQQVAGVNLDEEAARMIRFEQGYNASAQMIKVAQDVFQSLLGTFR
ncbi:MAG: flagellar basal body rod C-terminal domain-containing protein, partial [Natronospirillum sp.]